MVTRSIGNVFNRDVGFEGALPALNDLIKSVASAQLAAPDPQQQLLVDEQIRKLRADTNKSEQEFRLAQNLQASGQALSDLFNPATFMREVQGPTLDGSPLPPAALPVEDQRLAAMEILRRAAPSFAVSNQADQLAEIADLYSRFAPGLNQQDRLSLTLSPTEAQVGGAVGLDISRGNIQKPTRDQRAIAGATGSLSDVARLQEERDLALSEGRQADADQLKRAIDAAIVRGVDSDLGVGVGLTGARRENQQIDLDTVEINTRNALDQIDNLQGKLGEMTAADFGASGNFASFVANTANTLTGLGQLTGMTGINESDIGASVLASGETVDEAGKRILDKIDSASLNNVRFRSNLISLAYAIAAAQFGQEARSLSDADFENTLRSLGQGAASPRQMQAVLEDARNRLVQRFETVYNVRARSLGIDRTAPDLRRAQEPSRPPQIDPEELRGLLPLMTPEERALFE